MTLAKDARGLASLMAMENQKAIDNVPFNSKSAYLHLCDKPLPGVQLFGAQRQKQRAKTAERSNVH